MYLQEIKNRVINVNVKSVLSKELNYLQDETL